MNDDPALQAKQRKAEGYMEQPDRFKILSIVFHVSEGETTYILSYHAGVWRCSCGKQAPCSHALATKESWKGNIPLPEPSVEMTDL